MNCILNLTWKYGIAVISPFFIVIVLSASPPNSKTPVHVHRQTKDYTCIIVAKCLFKLFFGWFLLCDSQRTQDKQWNATSLNSSPWWSIKFSLLALFSYSFSFGMSFLLWSISFVRNKFWRRFPLLLFTGRPSSGISLEPRPYSARYMGRSGSPRFSQNAVGPLNRLRPGSESSGERSPVVRIPAVEVSFC